MKLIISSVAVVLALFALAALNASNRPSVEGFVSYHDMNHELGIAGLPIYVYRESQVDMCKASLAVRLKRKPTVAELFKELLLCEPVCKTETERYSGSFRLKAPPGENVVVAHSDGLRHHDCLDGGLCSSVKLDFYWFQSTSFPPARGAAPVKILMNDSSVLSPKSYL